MKFYAIGLLAFLGGALGANTKTTAPFAPADCVGSNKNTCNSHLDICHWETATSSCSVANTAVVTGHPNPGTLGGDCDAVYTTIGNGKDKYTTPQGGQSCAAGLVCRADEEPAEGVAFKGICQDEQCQGKSLPDLGYKDDTEANSATIRVTICHRTCSATNPWVRITIDDDAWNGTTASGCGHYLQHNIEDECANKAPWTEWGTHHRDYLIRWHGTRNWLRTDMGWDQVTCTNGNCKTSQAEKDYWFYWERACPYVRRTKCCGDWELTGPCCGDVPYPGQTTSIQLEKKVIAEGADSPCANANLMEVTNQDMELHVGQLGEKVVYYYEAKNTGTIPLCNIMLSDPDISSGAFADWLIQGVPTKNPGEATSTSTMQDGCIYPGQSFCVPMPPGTNSAIQGYEVENAVVVATPIGVIPRSVPDVTATDSAGVDELPAPAKAGPVQIALEKKVGPGIVGACPAEGLMDELYTDSLHKEFTYFYIISNPSDSTLVCNIKLTDDKISSGKFTNLLIDNSFDVHGDMENGCLLPGGSVCVASPQTKSSDGVPKIPDGGEDRPATVTGSKQDNTEPVSASDNAAVLPVAVTLQKQVVGAPTSGIYSGCPNADLMMELYVNPPDTEAWYAYTITNTGDQTLCDITLSDGSLLSGSFNNLVINQDNSDMTSGCLAPDESVCILQASKIPNSDGDKDDLATVTAMPQGETGAENLVSASDNAGVLPTSVDLRKKVDGGDSSQECPNIDSMAANALEIYSGRMGTKVTYFYFIKNTGLVKICHIVLSDALENGGFGNVISGVEMTEGCLEPGQSICYKVQSSIPNVPEDTTAEVKAVPSITPEIPYPGEPTVSDTDNAKVIPAGIQLVKKVKKGVDDTCPGNMKSDEGLETAHGAAPDVVTYFYLITNTGPTRLCNILLSDPDIAGYGFTELMVNGCLEPGQSTCLVSPIGPQSERPIIPPGGETKTAEVTGVPSDEQGNSLPGDGKVSDQDDATVVENNPVNPAITLEKKVEAVASTQCPNEDLMAPGDTTLETATGNVGAQVTFYYNITNTGDTYLCHLLLSDPNISGNPILLPGIDVMPDGCLAPGESICFVPPLGPNGKYPTIPDAKQTESAKVVATPSNPDKTNISGQGDVSATNDATVAPLASSILLEKKVEAKSATQCPNADLMAPENPTLEIAEGLVGAPVTFYYNITNNGDTYICHVLLSDPKTVGIALDKFDVMPDGCLAPGESICFVPPVGSIPDGLPNGQETTTASVFGTPSDSKGAPSGADGVTFNDDATVKSSPPSQPSPESTPLESSILLEKKVEAKSATQCPNAALMAPGDTTLEIAEGPVGAPITFYYNVTNTGETYLCHLLLSDPVSGNPLSNIDVMPDGCLAPGASICFVRPLGPKGAYPQIPSAPETKSATVSGTPSGSDKTPTGAPDVTSSNAATVKPVTPSVPQPPSECPFPMPSGALPDALCPNMNVARVDMIIGDPLVQDFIRSAESSLIYDFSFVQDEAPVTGLGIKFKVNNPFAAPGGNPTDVLVDYFKPVGHKNAYGDECLPMSFDNGCGAVATSGDGSITAQCVKPIDGRPAHTLVDIYFVTNDPRAANSAAPFGDCCESAFNTFDGQVKGGNIVKVQYYFYCECPDMAPARRRLRGAA